MSQTVLLLNPISAASLSQLRHSYSLLTLYDADNPGGLIAKHKSDIRAVIAGEKSKLKAGFVETLENLELICIPHRALDNIDADIKSRGSLKIVPIGSESVSDYSEQTIALLLGLSRRLTEISMMYRTHHWRASSRHPGHRIQGKTFAIFGDERMKQQVVSVLTALNANILDATKYDDLKDITYNTDHLILLPGLNKDQFGFLGREALDNLDKTSMVIANHADEVLNIQDIAIALHNRKLGGFAMDTHLGSEELPEQLLTMENVLITPGISASTLEASEEFGQAIFKLMTDHFNQ